VYITHHATNKFNTNAHKLNNNFFKISRTQDQYPHIGTVKSQENLKNWAHIRPNNITTYHKIRQHITNIWYKTTSQRENTYLSGLEPLLIKLEFIIYLPKLKVKFILWDDQQAKIYASTWANLMRTGLIIWVLTTRILDDGIEPTPRNMITRTKLFESNWANY